MQILKIFKSAITVDFQTYSTKNLHTLLYILKTLLQSIHKFKK